MLLVCDDNQKIIAKFRARPSIPTSKTLVATSRHMHELFRVMKELPNGLVRIEVNYPGINDDFYPFNKETEVDIENIVAQNEQNTERTIGELKTLFVAPTADTLPEDGVLQYATIETLYDFDKVPDRSVVTVKDDQLALVRCIADNPTLFGLNLHTLTGLPTANYSVAFDEATWSFDKVAYAPFISELRIAGEIEAQLESQSRTVYDKEKASYTRKTGQVKEHTDFTQVTAADDTDDDEMRL